MKRTVLYFLIVLTSIFSQAILGQDAVEQCMAEARFQTLTDCTGQVGGEKCVSLDLSGSLDPNGKDFVYDWDFGDGLTKKGLKVEHCYEDYGNYEVALNLVDPVGGAFIKNELITKVDIQKPFLATIDFAAAHTNTPAEFSYHTNLPKDFVVDQVYWDFGDDTYNCGEKVDHVFHEVKSYNVRVIVEGLNPWGDSFALCSNKKISVDGLLDGLVIEDIFEKKAEEMGHLGRYLDDESHYVLFDKNDHSHMEYIQMDGKHGIPVEVDREYAMYAWKGNIFTPIIEFSTKGDDDHEAHRKLGKALDELVASQPILLESTYFELNQTHSGERGKVNKGIKKNITFLKKYPYVKVEVGVYTHTGGRLARNLSISEKRAKALRKLIISEGISEDNVSYATAKTNRKLLNTCDGTPECHYEDERLNKRADFRVVGFK